MDDEQFERQVRAAIRRIGDTPASNALRARADAIAREYSSVASTGHRFARSGRLIFATLSVAVAVLGGVLMFATRPNGTASTSYPGISAHAPTETPISSSIPTRGEIGVTWGLVTRQQALSAASMHAIVEFNGQFVAVGTAQTPLAAGMAWTSPDGTHWTRQPMPSLAYPEAIAVGSSGLVAVGYRAEHGDTVAAAWTSPNGRTWTPVDISKEYRGWGISAVAVASGPGGLVALGTAGPATGPGIGPGPDRPLVWHSRDGTYWTPVSFPDHAANLESIASGSSEFIIGGSMVVGNARNAAIWTSRDGATWSRSRNLPDSNGAPAGDGLSINVIVAGPDRVLAIAGRAHHEATGVVWSSSDGVRWVVARHLTDQDPRYLALAWAPGGFIAAGLVGNDPINESLVVQVSEEGAVWQTRLIRAPEAGAPAGIAATANRIVVVGNQGEKPDGLVLVSPASLISGQ